MMLKRSSGLGRGLGALIPPKSGENKNQQGTEFEEDVVREDKPDMVAVTDSDVIQNVIRIPIEKVIPNENQPRLYFDHAGLEDLVSSIKQHGILQPLVVIALPDGRYELIAGERRLRASKIAGLESVPAIVRTANHQEKLELAIIENVQRKDLNPIEEAKAYVQLKEEFGLTQDQIGERVGKSRPQVGNIMRLLDLEQEIQQALIEEKISQSNARTLLSIPDSAQRKDLFEQMLKGDFTVRQAEARIPAANKRAKTIDPNILDLEARLRTYFGSKVQVKRKPQGNGEIRIEFGSDEDLQRILDKLQNN